MTKANFPELVSFLDKWSDEIPEPKRLDFYADMVQLLHENAVRTGTSLERNLRRRIEEHNSSDSRNT